MCVNELCQAPACDDDVRNGEEVDVDCGAECGACADGRLCARAVDCVSQVCRDGVCAVPACNDGVRNGAEVDVDCGADCAGCAPGARCELQSDCISGVCDGARCQAPTCEDGVSNGQETGNDCGGNCDGCQAGQSCLQADDCQSQVCDGELCAAPSCEDGVSNGAEFGVDCGGECGSCSCASAAVVVLDGVGQLRGTTVDAYSFEDGRCASSGGAPEVVHQFAAPEVGVYCASTAGSDFDTVLYLRADCNDRQTESQCNDAVDYPADNTSAFNFVADANDPVFIVVDGYSGENGEAADRGAYTLTVSAGRCDGAAPCQGDDGCGDNQACDRGLCVDVPLPCEDFGGCPFNFRCQDNLCRPVGGSSCDEDAECGFERRCVNATCEDPPPTGSCRPDRVIDLDGYGSFDGTTAGGQATHSGSCAVSVDSGEVVHRFSVEEATEVCIQTEGSGFDTVAYVRSTCAQEFAENGCNDDSPRGGQSSEFTFFAFGGQDFFIFVDGDDSADAAAGEYRLTVSEGACPRCAVNAECPDRQVCVDQQCQPTIFERDVLVSEISTAQGGAQWIELYNGTDRPKSLAGCVLESGDSAHDLDGLQLEPGAYSQISPISFMLAPRPALRLLCHQVVVDEVDFSQAGFPPEGEVLSLSDDLMTAVQNDDGRAWCPQAGTPNEVNPHCDRCAADPCAAPGEPFCRGDSVVTPTRECSDLEGRLDVACVNGEEVTACEGAVCQGGACVRQPQPGEIVISEIMYDPQAVSDANGEWIEIYNPTEISLTLENCALRDDVFTAEIEPMQLPAGAYAVFARNADPNINGGVQAAGTFSFSLNNSGERIRLECGDSMIDVVNYAQDGFIDAEGRSLNLSNDRLTAEANNLGPAWCHGVELINGPGSDRGSPGGPNPNCGGCNPNPCQAELAARCDGDARVVPGLPGACELEFGQPMCAYPEERIECGEGETCEDGACVIPLVGCQRDGCALGQVCNLESAECEAAPAVGTCAAPTLIEWSPGDGEVLNIQGSTAGAGSVVGDATCGDGAPGPEAVYRLTLDREAVVCVSTDSPHVQADTVLYIRTTCDDPESELEPPDSLGCSDDIGDWDGDGTCDSPIDGCTVPSELQLNGLEAQTYFIIVDSNEAGEANNFALSLLPGPCPSAPAPVECALDVHCPDGDVCLDGLCQEPPGPNAACEPEALVALPGAGRYEGNTTGKPFGLNARCADTEEQPEVVHQVRFDRDTPICVSTVGSSFDTVLSVRRARCDGNEVACNDDVTDQGPSQSKLEFNANAGVDYYVVVDGWNLGFPSSGDYVLDIAEGRCADAPGPCAADDSCPGTCSAPTLVDQFGEWEENTLLAGAAIDTHSCSNAVGPEAVYQLGFDARTTVCLSTYGSDPNNDTVVSVRNDCRTQNNTIACNDDYAEHTVHSEIELDLEEGDAPFVVVDSLGAGGDFIFSVTQGPCPNCRGDEDCPGSLSCVEMRCVECQEDNECGAGLVCQDERCVFPPCEVDGDCADDQICQQGQCAGGDRGSCDADVLVELAGVGVHQGTTAGARSTLAAGCAGSQASPEVAHEITFDADETVCVSTEGSGFDTVVYVRTNWTGERTELTCDDDRVSGPALTSRFTLNALSNIPYFIVVDGKDAGGNAVSGDYTLTVSDGACPVCAVDGDCAAGRVCEANQCIECRVDDDCGGDELCQENRCVLPALVCDAENPCPPTDWQGILGQFCDLDLGGEGQGLCVDRGMCRNPIPFQIGDLVEGNNIGRERVYLADCGDRGGGAEVIYTFEAPADGLACFTVVDAQFDYTMYLKDTCGTNPSLFVDWFLECTDVDVANNFSVDLVGGETYFLSIDANAQEDEGTFTLFSHFGACGALPPPQCEVNEDCALGQTCTEQRQCVTPIGTCEEPVEITELGTYSASLRTARNQLDPAMCDACVNPGGGRCAESVYHYRPQQGGPVCVTTEGSNFDTLLYVRRENCESGQAELACSDDVEDGAAYSELQIQTQAGADYYIIADSWAGPGRLQLTISEGGCQ